MTSNGGGKSQGVVYLRQFISRWRISISFQIPFPLISQQNGDKMGLVSAHISSPACWHSTSQSPSFYPNTKSRGANQKAAGGDLREFREK